MMLLYSSFINVNMETRDFDIIFTCLYWNIFLVKVLCRLEFIVCSPSFGFFSLFSLFSGNVLFSDLGACFKKDRCSHRRREFGHNAGASEQGNA